jgi:hypothetical protein
LLILLVLVIAALLARDFLVPESFGETGHFRHDSIGEFMEQPVIHGTDRTCRKCHDEEYRQNTRGKHAAVPCETCHGPLMLHADPKADKDQKIADAYLDRSYVQCAVCHQQQGARPKDFPQAIFLDHVNEFLVKEGLEPKEVVPRKICALCHPAHDPSKKE